MVSVKPSQLKWRDAHPRSPGVVVIFFGWSKIDHQPHDGVANQCGTVTPFKRCSGLRT